MTCLITKKVVILGPEKSTGHPNASNKYGNNQSFWNRWGRVLNFGRRGNLIKGVGGAAS